MSLSIPESIRLLLPDGKVEKLRLEDYVRGVVAATLPADTPLEALKAQAVAARTFGANTRRHVERGADVCTRRHCQVWRASTSLTIARAVAETHSLVATFEGRLIDAFYFEHCDGHTRDAAGMLMPAPSYLSAVVCPCGFATLKGHGVGMCQRGAVVMARFGDLLDVILKHYYSGIVVERASVARAEAQPELDTRTAKRLRPVELSRPAVTPAPEPDKPRPAPKRASPVRPKSIQTGEGPKKSPLLESAPLPSTTHRAPPRRAPKREVESPLPEPSHPAAPPVAPKTVEPAQIEPTPPAANVARPLEKAAPPGPIAAPAPAPAQFDADTSSWYPTAEEMGAPVEALPEVENIEDQLIAPTPDVIARAPLVAPLPLTMPESTPEPLTVSIPQLPSIDTKEIAPALPAPESHPEQISRSRATVAVQGFPPVEAGEVQAFDKVIIDHLPGPRVIAGNLLNPGIIVTMRDEEGHAVITVSGAAKQHGGGGFEAPAAHDGTFTITFNHEAVEVQVENETVFIHYAE